MGSVIEQLLADPKSTEFSRKKFSLLEPLSGFTDFIKHRKESTLMQHAKKEYQYAQFVFASGWYRQEFSYLRRILAFITRLQQERMQMIVDVRELPLTHKQGHPKTALGERLMLAGIAKCMNPPLAARKSSVIAIAIAMIKTGLGTPEAF